MPLNETLPTTLTIADAAAGLAAGEYSAVELADAAFARIAAVDGEINAFRALDRDGALAAAAASDQRRREGKTRGPLDGVPLSVKDNFMTRGVKTTCSSKMLEDYVPPFDAGVVERLREAGAVLVGKVNLDEFAMGATGETCAWGPVRHPLDKERVAGGSSAGSAAATAYGGGLGSVASDTGGSIRVPAAFCGLVGLKPTYGRVSRWGVAPLASSLDQAGVITRAVEDGALLLQAIAGHDPRDGASARQPLDNWPEACANAAGGLAGARLGWLPELLDLPEVDPEIAANFRAVMETCRKAGATLVELSLPRLRHGLAAYHVICPGEAYANLARFDGFRYGRRGAGADWIASVKDSRGSGFGLKVKRNILLGAYALAAAHLDDYYLKAGRVRRLLAGDLAEALARCDALLMPVSPVPPPRLGELAQKPLQALALDLFNVAANLAGLPALSFRAGTAAGLPAGAQLVGRAWDEKTLFRLAAAYEKSTTANS